MSMKRIAEIRQKYPGFKNIPQDEISEVNADFGRALWWIVDNVFVEDLMNGKQSKSDNKNETLFKFVSMEEGKRSGIENDEQRNDWEERKKRPSLCDKILVVKGKYKDVKFKVEFNICPGSDSLLAVMTVLGDDSFSHTFLNFRGLDRDFSESSIKKIGLEVQSVIWTYLSTTPIKLVA